MSNKIIYPVLIIIFSILIIYALLSKRKNDKLNNNIEKFLSYNPVDTSNDNLSNNNINNYIITKDFANGSWTTPWTHIDNNGQIKHVMTIEVDNTMTYNSSLDSYGKVHFTDYSNNHYHYSINYIYNENIVGKPKNKNSGNNYIFIKIFNIFSNESTDAPESNGTITALVKMYNGNQVTHTFYSYKIQDMSNTQYVQKLLDTSNSYIPKPPEIFDLPTYQTITNKYKYAPELITMTYGPTNNTILNKINQNYSGGIRYSIQRVFSSVTGNNITTAMSPTITLPGAQGNSIGSYVVIKSFKSDFDGMGLTSYFKPVSTLLFFYKMTNLSTAYSFSDTNLYNTPNSTFNLKNNSSNMYQSNIQYNNLNSITQTNTSTYQLVSVGSFGVNDIDQEIKVSFSKVYNLF